MKDFFKGVRKHLGKLDNERLREQYSRVADELAFSEMIFHTTSDGYFVLEENGDPSWTNPAAERLLGMRLADILPTLEIPLGKASKRELSVSYPEPRVLELQTIPMGRETLVKLVDITAARARSEADLQAGATEAVKRLASGVAHEIANPLNAISLNLQLLEREHPDDESITECRAQIKRLDGILRGFLEALRPVKPVLRPESVTVPLKNCLAALRPQFEEHEISVNLDIPAALPMAAIDSDRLEQVFFNLLKNSLEAMKDGGSVAIAVGSDDNDVFVKLRDSGAGMDTETLSHLFEAYRTTKDHGNGLGLMISQRIVRDHGGSIAVVSAPGEGTEFTIRLPRLERRVRRIENG